MADPNLNPASQQWGRNVTASIVRVDTSLVNAQNVARIADGNLQTSITRASRIAVEVEQISNFMLTLAVVETASRTNAIGV